MMPAQRPQDRPHLRSDRRHHEPPTLTRLTDLAGVPVDLGPPQRPALRKTQARRRGEREERREVLGRGGSEPLCLVADQLAHARFGLWQKEFAPLLLMVEADVAIFAVGECGLETF